MAAGQCFVDLVVSGRGLGRVAKARPNRPDDLGIALATCLGGLDGGHVFGGGGRGDASLVCQPIGRPQFDWYFQWCGFGRGDRAGVWLGRFGCVFGCLLGRDDGVFIGVIGTPFTGFRPLGLAHHRLCHQLVLFGRGQPHLVCV